MYYGFDFWEGGLCHYGRLGQRWGIRRYQNEDGSLTPAGVIRYAKYEAKMKRAENKAERIKAKAVSSRRIGELSDSELQKKINRMKLEKKYKDMKNASLKEGASLISKYIKYRQQKQEAALAKENRDREYDVLKKRLAMEDKELDIRKQEAIGRTEEAKERTKQNEATARQAQAQAEQAKANAQKEANIVQGMKTRAGRKHYKAELINAKTSLKAIKNKNKSISLVNKILGRSMVKNWSTPDEYKQYAAMLLGGNNKQKQKEEK